MDAVTKHYTTGNLTVVWKSALCQHSCVCWKGLPEVFKPKENPWINVDGAEAERIMEQVKKCPSGALTFEIKEQ